MFADVNGIRLYYEVKGSGPPLILLHGNSTDHRFLSKLASLFSEHFTVYSIDSRAHGKSEKSDVLGYRIMALDIAEFIVKLDLKKPALLGSSDGGIIGLVLAVAYPDLLSALVACGANAAPTGLKRRYRAFIKILHLGSLNPKYKMILNEPDLSAAELISVKTPTLIMAGQFDIVHRIHTLKMARLIPGSEVCIVPGEGHTSYLTRSAEKCVKRVLPFIEKAREKLL